MDNKFDKMECWSH